jgi:hypothetical protein
MACLYAFKTVRSISPASRLVSFTKLLPMRRSCGKVASTILSKSPLLSPSLNLYVLHIANRHCRPAKTEEGSCNAFSSLMVTSTKSGHCLGKSQCRIFCRATTSCARALGCAFARIGTRRALTEAFSWSEIGVVVGEDESSGLAQPLLTRFLKYTTAVGVRLARCPLSHIRQQAPLV